MTFTTSSSFAANHCQHGLRELQASVDWETESSNGLLHAVTG